MRRAIWLRMWVVAVTGGLALGVAGCDGRASPAGDGGSGTDSGTDGQGDGSAGACSGLTENRCRFMATCVWIEDCDPCDGTEPGGRCYDFDGPRPAVGCDACNTCTGLDEASCEAQTGCVADYCFNCSCTPGYAGCRDEAEAPTECPALGCPQPDCNECGGLDEAACRQNPSCTVGECPNCDGNPSLFCLEKGQPVACPPVACGECHDFDADEESCRAAPGCTSGDCPGCNGDTIFVGCFNPTELIGCPELVCAPTCSSDADCGGSGASCAPPGTPQGCGNCFQPPPEETCQSDADCVSPQLGTICEVPACSCDGSTRICLQGCVADSECGDGQICGVDSRCAPRPCNGSGDCPENFECSSSGSGGSRCQRLDCNVAGDCDGVDRFCVEGQCYDSPGECRFPVP